MKNYNITTTSDITEELLNEIKEMEKAMKLLETNLRNIKENVKDVMNKEHLDTMIVSGMLLKVASVEKVSIDSKKLKADFPELFTDPDYTKVSKYSRLTIR